MNGGLKILIARMETHPEEFEGEGKWISSFNNYKKYMSEEEKDVFWKKLCELKMNEFEQKIVKRLMQEETPDQMELDINQHEVAVKKQVELMKAVMATKATVLTQPGQFYVPPEEPKPKTIFGRLFNYQ